MMARTLWLVMKIAVNMIEGEAKFMQTIGAQFCKVFIWELMKLVVKLRDEQEQNGMYAQYPSTAPAAKQKLQYCLCPMGGSVVYAAPKAKPKKSSQSAPAPSTVAGKSGRQGKRKSKRQGKIKVTGKRTRC